MSVVVEDKEKNSWFKPSELLLS